MNRIKEFLSADEGVQAPLLPAAGPGETAITVLPSDFAWAPLDELGNPVIPLLEKLELSVPVGQLLSVIGGTGEGKSSLLAAIAGEMTCLGTAETNPVAVRGRVAYVPQQTWVFDGTVRENILFGRPWDEARYNDIVRVCCLTRDLLRMPAGDQTSVGERGACLSGGQKQRIGLARAVYADADVYLLDEPLSALDARVAHRLFHDCICGYLQGKTRLLATSRLEFVDGTDRIVLLEEGKIIADGSYSHLLATNAEFADLLDTMGPTEEDGSDEGAAEVGPVGVEEVNKSAGEEAVEAKEELEEAESPVPPAETHTKQASVTITTLAVYARAMGGWPVVTAIFLLNALTEGCRLGASVWVSMWSEGVAHVNQTNPASTDATAAASRLQLPHSYDRIYLGAGGIDTTTGFYLSVYSAISGAQTLLTLISTLAVALAGLAASSALHDRLLVRLLRAPMAFFNTTPIGRILNRFSQVIGDTDRTLATSASVLLRGVVQIAGTVVIIGLATPYTLVTFVPELTVLFWTYRYFQATDRELKELTTQTGSPVTTYCAQCLKGLPIIRALRSQPQVGRSNQCRHKPFP